MSVAKLKVEQSVSTGEIIISAVVGNRMVLRRVLNHDDIEFHEHRVREVVDEMRAQMLNPYERMSL